MPLVTMHQYIKKYPIKKTDKYLILGTIHPHLKEKVELDFFYGNTASLWKILSDACSLELNSLENILTFLNDNNIAISDMILNSTRDNEATTQDSALYDLDLNLELKEQILKSNISTIFFTSAFSKNNAAKLFCKAFNIATPKNWRENYEFDIQLEGKLLKGIILLSPSGSANIGIANNKAYKNKQEEYKIYKTPIKQFKIDFYKDKFCKLINKK